MSALRFSRARVAAGAKVARNAMKGPQARVVAGTAGVNVTVVLIGSLGGLFLARVLGPAQRGELVPILQWPATIGTVLSFGIAQSACYWISRRPKKASAFMSTAVAAALATGLVVLGLSPWVTVLIARNAEVAYNLSLVFALAPVYIGVGVWMSALQATRITAWNVTRLLQPVLYLLLVVTLWALGKLTLRTVVIAFAVSLIVQTVYSAVVARRVVGHLTGPNWSLVRPLYAYGFKVGLSTVPELVNVYFDQLVLSVLPSIAAAQLGNYAVAASLSWLALPASVAFGSVAFPRLARATEEEQAQRIERLSLLGAGLLAALSIGLLSALAPILVPTLFGSGYKDAVVALWLLAPGTVFLALNRVMGDLLQGRGQPLLRSIGQGLGAILTIALLLILIPPFGIRGAAVASSVTYGAVFLFLAAGLRFARRTRPFAPIEP